MPETVHVTVGGGEDDGWWCDEAMPGDSEGNCENFEADIPAELYQQFRLNMVESDALRDAIFEAAGYGGDGRLTECCPEWKGEVGKSRVWWQVDIEASGDPAVFPVIRHTHGPHFDTPGEAEAFIAELPETVYVFSHHAFPVPRSAFTVSRQGYDAQPGSCDRCGWTRREHQAANNDEEAQT